MLSRGAAHYAFGAAEPAGLVGAIPGTLADRRSPLGELHWVLTALTLTLTLTRIRTRTRTRTTLTLSRAAPTRCTRRARPAVATTRRSSASTAS